MTGLGALALLLGTALAAPAEQAPAGPAGATRPGQAAPGSPGSRPVQAPPGVAARVGSESIPMSEVVERAAGELARIERERHRLLESTLEDLIAERLLAAEARRRGVGVDRLVETEVTARTSPVTGADVEGFIAQNRDRLPPGMEEAELRTRVTDHLRREALARRRAEFVETLRAATPVHVYLKEPEPVRVRIDPGKGFARGPKEAPVSIVEFSDFGCPFCQRVVETVKGLTTRYGTRVRWVFRDFPIEGLHPQAPLAHEAARCAAEQDRFWAYHDLLFERAPHLAPADLRQYAKEVGLEPSAFGACLDSRKYRAAVDADIETGQRLGVTGTPTFFINGVPLVGNQSPAAFRKVIDRELARPPR